MFDVRRREFITLLGGGLLSCRALRATAVFAQGMGRWTIGTPMPSARTEVAVAEVGGKIYVVGGFGGERELEIYDSAAGRWSRGALIPRALHHAAAVGWQDKLYVVGGFVEGEDSPRGIHRIRDRGLAGDEAPSLLGEVEHHARSDPEPSPQRLGNRDLSFLGHDGFHTCTVGIPTHLSSTLPRRPSPRSPSRTMGPREPLDRGAGVVGFAP